MLSFSLPHLGVWCSLLSPFERVDPDHLKVGEQLRLCKKTTGWILHAQSISTIRERKTIIYPFSFIVYNSKPIGHQVI